jgi:hypothetical protein
VDKKGGRVKMNKKSIQFINNSVCDELSARGNEYQDIINKFMRERIVSITEFRNKFNIRTDNPKKLLLWSFAIDKSMGDNRVQIEGFNNSLPVPQISIEPYFFAKDDKTDTLFVFDVVCGVYELKAEESLTQISENIKHMRSSTEVLLHDNFIYNYFNSMKEVGK